MNLGNIKKNKFSFGISLDLHYLCTVEPKNNEEMEARRTNEQAVNWLKAAQKRQQDWQQEVKKRWGEGFYAAIIVENRNPRLTDITADFDQTAVALTNKPSE